MAATLARAGHPLLVWNRDSEKAAKVAGETGSAVAATPAEVAERVPVLITSLADDAAVLEVYLGDEGIVHGIGPGTIAIETSTIAPETVMTVGEALDSTGGGFVDCPVSGSVATVEAGALTIMAGGDETLIDRVEPVLEALAARIVRVGKRGSGASCKLAVNALVHGLNIALSEALVLAERAGVAREVAYEVFASGAGGAPFVQYKRQAYEHPEDTPVAFSLDLVAKDLELITGLAKRVGAPMAQAEAGLGLVHRAIASGMGDDDLSAVAQFLRKAAS